MLTRPNQLAPLTTQQQLSNLQTQAQAPQQYLTSRQRKRLYKQPSSTNVLREQSGPGAAATSLAESALHTPSALMLPLHLLTTDKLQGHQNEELPAGMLNQGSLASSQLATVGTQLPPADAAQTKQIISPRLNAADFKIVGSDEVLPVVNILANLESQLQRQLQSSGADHHRDGNTRSNSNNHRTRDQESTPMTQQALHSSSRASSRGHGHHHRGRTQATNSNNNSNTYNMQQGYSNNRGPSPTRSPSPAATNEQRAQFAPPPQLSQEERLLLQQRRVQTPGTGIRGSSPTR